MTSFSSLRARLVGTVFLAVAPAWLATYLIVQSTGTQQDLAWTFLSGAIGLLALAAAWFGGEHFVLRQVRLLLRSAHRLASGDFSSRSGLSNEEGELGELARAFDSMAQSLEERTKEREQTERTLLNRSFQQTVVGALGQFAMVSKDLNGLWTQTAMLASQTLEVEYCGIFELMPQERTLVLRAGTGWPEGLLNQVCFTAEEGGDASYVLGAGEPVIADDIQNELRFTPSEFMHRYGVVSAVMSAISGHGARYGFIGVFTTTKRIFSEDEVHFLFSMSTLVAMALERIKAEAELRKVADFSEQNPNPAMALDDRGRVTFFNNAALRLAEALDHTEVRSILPANIEQLAQQCLAMRPGMLRFETVYREHTLSWSLHPVMDAQAVHCYVEDITNRLNLEEQLRQSQKMESVGLLAAGVAHDFNNMLTIIQGHSGMLMARKDLPQRLLDSAKAIFFGAERAANLTRQLLLFSRKTVIQPKPLDLREVVANMSKMLQRLLGETIRLTVVAPDQMPLIHADAGMLEQILMNLAVNARDAMPKGGRLVIETFYAEIDDQHAAMHTDARPGSFSCLRVRDNGCGMDSATMARIFEPFFTTKDVGKGTGLGLATVYGIVKQHDGWIEAESEPGVGTTFSIYFPASSGLAVKEQPAETPSSTTVPGGNETILVVEDEPVLRDLAHLILESSGYRVLEAGSGVEALKIWEKEGPSIDLVVTDMVMPEGLSGMDLAQRLHALRPDLRIIFASGYSMEEIDTSFLEEGHSIFIQKPYTHITLSKAVRDCLNQKA